MTSKIMLPKKDDNGKYYLSYSQVKSWQELKGFNTGKPGKHEYIMRYFFGESFEDKGGFGQFGKEVEDYITLRESSDKFSSEEKKLLDTIHPLGNFQVEFKLDYGDFYVLGYIDDATEDLSYIRDYKTASEKSKEKYYKDDYTQLDVYALAVKQITGNIPKLEVKVIERLGNGFRGGRDVMTVGDRTWTIERETSEERLESIYKNIEMTAIEISDYYKVFLKLNKVI